LDTTATTRDDNTSKDLDTSLVTFFNLEVNANAIPYLKVGAVVGELIFSDFFEDCLAQS
jgi:hypothetical protein